MHIVVLILSDCIVIYNITLRLRLTLGGFGIELSALGELFLAHLMFDTEGSPHNIPTLEWRGSDWLECLVEFEYRAPVIPFVGMCFCRSPLDQSV